MSDNEKYLFETIIQLKTLEECISFFKDLCTPKEINNMAERLRVANLLLTTKLSYRQITQVTGISINTVTRVARFIKHESNHGYRNIFTKQSQTN